MSAEAKSSSDLIIPTVTEDDLRAFHSTHFPSSQPAPGPDAFASAAAVSEAEGDDDLGFYEDGVKRTLTDEQIALFRHSEIETLLRERRHRAEAGEEELPPPQAARYRQPSDYTPIKQPVKDGESRASNAAKNRARRHKLSTKTQHVSREDPQGRTHRRLARELDQVAEAPMELDY